MCDSTINKSDLKDKIDSQEFKYESDNLINNTTVINHASKNTLVKMYSNSTSNGNFYLNKSKELRADVKNNSIEYNSNAVHVLN